MSANFFAALDDSGDEAPAPAKSNTKKRESKAVKKGAAPVTTPKASTTEATKVSTEATKTDERRRPNQNDRNTKSGRGGRAPTRDGKRAYDRRSGTGRGKEIKKGGGGARNWGNDKADAKKMEGKIDEKQVTDEQPVKQPTEVEEVAEQDAPVVEKIEDKTVTYADYMASKDKKEETVRETENEFKNVAASTKVEEDFLVMGAGKAKKSKKKKDGKQTVEVGFRVAKPESEPSSERSERGGRGRGRGGDRGGRGGRGGDRGGRGGRGRGRGGVKGPGLNVQDEKAFPSL